MIIERRSTISGKVNRMNLDITEDQYSKWVNGELIQKVFPHLNEDEREFLLSGILPNEWDKVFGVQK